MSEKHTTDKFVSIDRYYISGLHPHIWKHPEGEMVYFDDYVNLWAENARLKAEVERLTNENGNNFVLKEEWYLKCLSARAEVERLRASSFVTAVPVEQYERLLKAGEEVIHEWSSGDEKEARNFMKALVIWNAAKEGKQS